MSLYGRGHRPDPIGHRVAHISLHPAVRAWGGELPPSVRVPTGPVSDQSATSSCTMHATGAALAPQVGFNPSQSDGYKLARSVWRADVGLPLTTKMTDQGAEPNELARALSVFGVRPRASGSDYDARNSDADPVTINDEVEADAFEKDAQAIILGQYAIRTLDDLEVALAVTKKPVTVAMFVDTKGPRSVEQWDPTTGPLGAPKSDPNGGGHYVCVRGVDRASGQRIWNVQNSWGPGWGLAGFFLATDEWAAQLVDQYVWDCRVAQ